MLLLLCISTPSSTSIPPPVLSVPANSKGRVSATSLQRSRSDVDVNAAAVAKHRYVGQTRAAGHLPPGSYSSLGKGPARWNEWLIRCRRQSAWWTGPSAQVAVKFWAFSKGSCCVKTLHTDRILSKDKHTWYSSMLGLTFVFTSAVPSFLLTTSCCNTCQNISMSILYMHVLYVKLILHVDWPDSVTALSVPFFKTNA